MKFRPLHDRVVVRRIDAAALSAGGIIVPDTAKEKPAQGEVVAVGPGAHDEAGNLVPIELSVGDRVLFGKWTGTEVCINNQDLLILKEGDILGVIEGPERALSELNYLRQYTDGWDGPGTKAALPRSFDLAEAFLQLVLDGGTIDHISAMIYAPGTAVLRLVADGLDARLEFLEDGTIAANVDDATGQHDLDVRGFNGKRVPAPLVKLLGRHYRARAREAA